jgi:hypothetical protein
MCSSPFQNNLPLKHVQTRSHFLGDLFRELLLKAKAQYGYLLEHVATFGLIYSGNSY